MPLRRPLLHAFLLACALGVAAAAPAGAQTMDAASTAAHALDAGRLSDAGGAEDASVGRGLALLDGGVSHEAPSEARRAPRRSAGSVARVTLGLFALLALAILGGHSSVRALERRTGLAMVTGSGVPFLLLGLIAHRPEVGILDDATLRDLTPLLEFGLGWIGFRVGADFDVRAMDRWPRGTARVMGAESACAFLVVVVAAGVALQVGLHPPNAVRNAILLGACAAVSAPTGVRAMEAVGLLPAERSRDLRRVAALDDVVGVLVLALVTSAFRPVSSAAWALPPLGWFFVQIGMGVVHGALLVSAARVARNANERFALTLGAIAFSAGMAGYVGFSPLVVGAVAGVVVANFPAAVEASDLISHARLREFERTIFMMFFVVTGALWEPYARAGWILAPLYVIARLAGKLLGLRAVREVATAGPPGTAAEPRPAPRARVGLLATWIALMPTSAVSIAIVVGARTAYGPILGGALETVVIVGALATEAVFRVTLHAAGAWPRGEAMDLGALALGHDELDAPPAPAPAPPTDDARDEGRS